MRRRGEDATLQTHALGTAASSLRQVRWRFVAARAYAKDARSRAAIEAMMADIERVARRADAMRLRLNAKEKSPFKDFSAPGF